MSKLRLFCDQNIRVDTIQFLRTLGHDVVSTRTYGMQRASDSEILERAISEGRVLLTFNSDFGDIRYYQPHTHMGIIRLRIDPQTTEVVHPILRAALALLSAKEIEGKLVTVTRSRVRIRSG